jgi:hypothetical protein
MVIETGTFKITKSIEEFTALDKAVADNYTSQQSGFISRSSAYVAEANEWIFIVHWEDMASAQGSISGFMNSEATKEFQGGINFETMGNTVYELATQTNQK